METPPDIALERVGSAMDPHRRAQERSLVAHRLIAERLLGEPAVLERAKARLERWTREGRIHPEWSSRWSALLERPPQDIADFLVDPAQSDLRQTSPFAGEIDPRERWKVWRSVA